MDSGKERLGILEGNYKEDAMTREEVLDKVNDIFKDVFNREDLVINFETTAKDVEDWDSLRQITLIEVIEDEFNMRFTMDEVVGMENVGSMIDIILSRI